MAQPPATGSFLLPRVSPWYHHHANHQIQSQFTGWGVAIMWSFTSVSVTSALVRRDIHCLHTQRCQVGAVIERVDVDLFGPASITNLWPHLKGNWRPRTRPNSHSIHPHRRDPRLFVLLHCYHCF